MWGLSAGSSLWFGEDKHDGGGCRLARHYGLERISMMMVRVLVLRGFRGVLQGTIRQLCPIATPPPRKIRTYVLYSSSRGRSLDRGSTKQVRCRDGMKGCCNPRDRNATLCRCDIWCQRPKKGPGLPTRGNPGRRAVSTLSILSWEQSRWL